MILFWSLQKPKETFPIKIGVIMEYQLETRRQRSFLPDLFGIQEFNDGLNSEKDISTDESELNREGFQ